MTFILLLYCLIFINCASIEARNFEQRIVSQGKNLLSNTLIQIRASELAYYSEISLDDITYWVSIKQNRLIYIRTSDIHFKTKDKLSVNSTVAECIDKYPNSIYVEPGFCIFVKLKDGWRACISTDLEHIPLAGKIQYFYKTDNNYYWTLTEWINYIEQDAEFLEDSISPGVLFLPAEDDRFECCQ